MKLFKALRIEVTNFIDAIVLYWPGSYVGSVLRARHYYRNLGSRIGKHLQIGIGTKIIPHKNMEIGENFVTGPGVYISADHSLGIKIGNDVSLAHGVFVRASNHAYFEPNAPITTQGHFTREVNDENGDTFSIIIGDDVWIGAYAVILAGSRIGHGSVIGAGTVVAGDIPEYAIVVGNPARTIGDRRKQTFAQKVVMMPPVDK